MVVKWWAEHGEPYLLDFSRFLVGLVAFGPLKVDLRHVFYWRCDNVATIGWQ